MRVASLLLLLALSHQLDAARVRRQEELDYGDDLSEDKDSNGRCRCGGTYTCYCVRSHQCHANGTINYDVPGDPPVLRYERMSETCPADDVCCMDVLGDDIAVTETPSPASCDKLPTPTCGMPSQSIDGDSPLMMALYWRNGSAWQFQCGTPLVSKDAYLTAVQCLKESNLVVGSCPENEKCNMDIVGDEVPDSETPPTTIFPSTNPTTTPPPTIIPTTTYTSTYTSTTTTTTAKPPRRQCGVRGRRKSVDGDKTDTEFGEIPWMLAIYGINGSEWKFQCGASLVGKNIGLTAAHCVKKFQGNLSNLKVRAGIWDLYGDVEYQQLDVIGIEPHPEYSSGPLWNDIALILTQQRFKRSWSVGPVCLPPSGFVFLEGTRCIVTGWSEDAIGSEGKLECTLKQVEAPLVPHDECQTRLRGTFLGEFFSLHESFMCAGGESETRTCKGYDGGALVCEVGGQYFQAGVASWGIACGAKSLPVVYVDVARYIDWIKEIFRSNSYTKTVT